MRVVVVYPEVLDMARYRSRRKEFPPFGAMYVASALEAAGHEVAIVKLEPDRLQLDLSVFDVVAFSISASATFNMFMECRESSQFKSSHLFIAGGVHVNLFPEQTLRDLKPDAIGIGEGETTTVELVSQHATRRFDKVAGVGYLDPQGKFVRTAPRKISKIIDGFAFPSRHLLPVEDFIMTDRMSNTDIRMTHIAPGRGCPFPCRYCASAQTRVQYRTGADIRLELEHLMDTYGVQGFAVVGNDFILSKNNVYDIAQAITPLKLQWATLSRVDRVDKEVLGAMASSGCHELEFGVESGSQKILDAMDKRATLEQAEAALRLTYESGIKNKVFLVHGYLGEDRQSTEETMAFLDRVGKWIERVSLFRFVPLPGTYVYNHAIELNIRGIPGRSGWDGDWGKFHIHHNHHHWWGSKDEFAQLTTQFWRLSAFVEERWPSRFSRDQLPEDAWQSQSAEFAKSNWQQPKTDDSVGK